ncbi:hypothetical protein [Cypionkella psychrotolerans]|uniref:hypothetical protein n=1 Tax=Cypionkella psychrotolerans TaxID=1678131 RepID=UPI000B328FB9|nr:hypothetical protein [Cypionkella psychrotolerans]
MKLVSSSPDRLVLRKRPVLMGIGIAAAMLLFAAIWLAKFFSNDHSDLTVLALLFGLFGVVFIVFVRQEVAVFDRPSNSLTLRSIGVLGAREQSRPLAEVTKAVLETSANDGDSRAGPSHRAVLSFTSGPPLPLSAIFRSGSEAKTAVQQINTWLNQKTGQTQKRPKKR